MMRTLVFALACVPPVLGKAGDPPTPAPTTTTTTVIDTSKHYYPHGCVKQADELTCPLVVTPTQEAELKKAVCQGATQEQIRDKHLHDICHAISAIPNLGCPAMLDSIWPKVLAACPVGAVTCTSSSDCPNDMPMCANGECKVMSCVGAVTLDGLWEDTWESVVPVQGLYTKMYLKYMAQSGCLCLFNDWISNNGPICTDNYNYFRFTLKGRWGNEYWDFYLYGDQTMKIVRDKKVIMPRGNPDSMGAAGYGITPNLRTKHSTYELCVPSQKGMEMTMTLADPVAVPATSTLSPPYQRVSSGTCASVGLADITDAADCNAAAVKLGLTDTSANTAGCNSGSKDSKCKTRPTGCIYASNDWLQLNDISTSVACGAKGTNYKNDCICKQQAPPASVTCAAWPSKSTYGCHKGGAWKKLGDTSSEAKCRELCVAETTTNTFCCYWKKSGATNSGCHMMPGGAVAPVGTGTGYAVECKTKQIAPVTCGTWQTSSNNVCIGGDAWIKLGDTATAEMCTNLCHFQTTTMRSFCCYWRAASAGIGQKHTGCFMRVASTVANGIGKGKSVICKPKPVTSAPPTSSPVPCVSTQPISEPKVVTVTISVTDPGITIVPLPNTQCPWLSHTGTPWQLQCKDGSKCTGWKCCNCRGGRAKCPSNYPVMCNQRRCGGGDHCCTNGKNGGCDNLGGERPCPGTEESQCRSTPTGDYTSAGMYSVTMKFNKCGYFDISSSTASCPDSTPYVLTDGNFKFKKGSCADKLLMEEFNNAPALSLTYLGCEDALKVSGAAGGAVRVEPKVRTQAPAWKPDTCGTVGGRQFGCQSSLVTSWSSGVATCQVWGDPHFTRAFDGSHYDFQAVGAFKLASTIDGSYEIQGFLVPYAMRNGHYRATVFAGVAVKSGSQTIVIIQDDIFVDGIQVSKSSLPADFCDAFVTKPRGFLPGICVDAGKSTSIAVTTTRNSGSAGGYWLNLRIEMAVHMLSPWGLCSGHHNHHTTKPVPCADTLFTTTDIDNILGRFPGIGMTHSHTCSGSTGDLSDNNRRLATSAPTTAAPTTAAPTTAAATTAAATTAAATTAAASTAAPTTGAPTPAPGPAPLVVPATDAKDACSISGISYGDTVDKCTDPCLKDQQPMIDACVFDFCLTGDTASIDAAKGACKLDADMEAAHAEESGPRTTTTTTTTTVAPVVVPSSPCETVAPIPVSALYSGPDAKASAATTGVNGVWWLAGFCGFLSLVLGMVLVVRRRKFDTRTTYVRACGELQESSGECLDGYIDVPLE